MRYLIILLILLLGVSTVNGSGTGGINFAKNMKQWPVNVKFRANIGGGSVFFTDHSFMYDFYSIDEWNRNSELRNHYNVLDRDDSINSYSYEVVFINGNVDSVIGDNILPYYHNYYLSNDFSKWAGKVPVYEEICYYNLYKKIDLKVYSNSSKFKYDFIIDSGGNPNDIQLSFKGVLPEISPEGNLVIRTTINLITELAPYAYQEISGEKREVKCEYELQNNIVSFIFPEGYDRKYPIIIDPTLIFATYSGSTSSNQGYCTGYDTQGNLFTGSSSPGNGWPTTIGAYKTAYNYSSIGINKYDSSGRNLLYSTYFGRTCIPLSFYTTAQDELVMLGIGYHFIPVTKGCYDSTFNGTRDLFVAHFDSSGSSLLGCTYVGGSGAEGLNGTTIHLNEIYNSYVTVDANGNIYVSSTTSSLDFPVTTNAYQKTYGGGDSDGCIIKLNSDCSKLLYSTYLGGNDEDACLGSAIDKNGNFVVVGGTSSTNLQLTPQPYSGQGKGFVCKFDSTDKLDAITLLGEGTELASCVALSPNGEIYVCGYLFNNDTKYKASSGVYVDTLGEVFINKLTPDLKLSLNKTRLIQGGSNSSIVGFQQQCDNIILCISEPRDSLQVTPNAFSSTRRSFYLCYLSPNMYSLAYGSYFGGPYSNYHTHCVGRIDPDGVYFQTACGTGSNFGATMGAFSTSSKTVGLDNISFKFDFAIPNTRVESGDILAPDSACINQSIQFQSTSTNGNSFSWDFGDGNISNTQNPTHTFNSSGIYLIKLVIENTALCKPIDSVSKTINILHVNKPIVSVNDTIICHPGEYHFQITESDTGTNRTYNWSPNSIIKGTADKGKIIAEITEESKLIITIKDSIKNFGCAEYVKDTIIVAFNNNNNMQVIGDTVICIGDTAILMAFGGDSYQWTPIEFINRTDSSSINAWPNESTTFSVKITKENGCFEYKTASIGVERILINASDDQYIKPGETAILNAWGGIKYLWSSERDTLTNPIVYTYPQSTTTYYVTGFSEQGCVSVDSIIVYVVRDISFPNAFSPNADGLNDYFGIIPRNAPGVTLHTLKVFNRFGQLVFNNNDKNSGWDGKYHGKYCDVGVYYYLCTYSIDGENKTIKGDVVLVK